MNTAAERHLLAHRAEIYWTESQRPLASLAFVAPLLAIYEIGICWFHVPPNGADALLRYLLNGLGLGQHLVLPALTVAILLVWHFLTRSSWRISGGVLSGMLVESVLLGFCVWGIAIAQGLMLNIFTIVADKVKMSIGFLGAGIYEELLFRLILLSSVAWLIRFAGVSTRRSMIAAALATSLLFAAAHHIGQNSDLFSWPHFAFRTMAGLFFSIVYVFRGFGIAAGSHAAYDIIVALFCV
jgi:membrane protease YdiL (CAAX protease family)